MRLQIQQIRSIDRLQSRLLAFVASPITALLLYVFNGKV